MQMQRQLIIDEAFEDFFRGRLERRERREIGRKSEGNEGDLILGKEVTKEFPGGRKDGEI